MTDCRITKRPTGLGPYILAARQSQSMPCDEIYDANNGVTKIADTIEQTFC